MTSNSNYLIKFLILSLAFGMTGCGTSGNAAHQGDIPGWVQNPASRYSDSQYLMAVGSGSTLNEAKSDAFARLSQIFRIDIEATQQVTAEFIDRSVNNAIFSESTSQLLNSIKIGTNQELMNSSILVSEVDKFGTYHALAAMDRAETARIYRKEISNNTLKIDDFENNAEQESNVLQKMVLLKKALAFAGANEVLTRQLTIIQGGAASGGEATVALGRIQEKFRSIRQKANVVIESKNATETIKSAIAATFQQEGFSISKDKAASILAVTINYQTLKADLNRDDAEFVKWELVVDVTDLQSNRSFKTFLAEGRDGAPSYADALKRADYSARKKIDTDFNSFFTNELFSTY